jgi:hypothetical protein
VERTFGWLNRERRLSKDYERLPATTEAFTQITMVRLMTRRLSRQARAPAMPLVTAFIGRPQPKLLPAGQSQPKFLPAGQPQPKLLPIGLARNRAGNCC